MHRILQSRALTLAGIGSNGGCEKLARPPSKMTLSRMCFAKPNWDLIQHSISLPTHSFTTLCALASSRCPMRNYRQFFILLAPDRGFLPCGVGSKSPNFRELSSKSPLRCIRQLCLPSPSLPKACALVLARPGMTLDSHVVPGDLPWK